MSEKRETRSLRVTSDSERQLVWLASDDRYYEEGFTVEEARALIAEIQQSVASLGKPESARGPLG